MNNALNEIPTCAHLFQVLANETRLAVVERLLSGPKHVAEINEGIGVEQSLLSHHLKVLRDTGLVSAERDGKQVLYSLRNTVQAQPSDRALHLGCCQIDFN